VEEIEKEAIIPKINSIVELERVYPYRNVMGNYWQRIESALKYIPEVYHFAALALFANVIYIPESILTQAWQYCMWELKERYGIHENNILNDSLLLTEEVDLLIEFLHSNNITGRLDIDKMPRSPRLGDIAAYLLLDDCLSKTQKDVIADESLSPLINGFKHLRTALKRNYWIIIVDKSLSGSSLHSELMKACKLREALSSNSKIIVIAQIITFDALKSTQKIKDEENIEIISAIYLDEKFKINSDQCELFNYKETHKQVKELCEWFDKNILSTDEIYGSNSVWREIGGDPEYGLAYGFKGCGLTLVTPNCPSNSIPLLWYHKPGRYEGPYPRVESRTSQRRSFDKQLINLLSNRSEKRGD
jgi:hypothetical protein